jgi:hypothetical protein
MKKTLMHLLFILALWAQMPSVAWLCKVDMRGFSSEGQQFCAQACMAERAVLDAQPTGYARIAQDAVCGGFRVASMAEGEAASALKSIRPMAAYFILPTPNVACFNSGFNLEAKAFDNIPVPPSALGHPHAQAPPA